MAVPTDEDRTPRWFIATDSELEKLGAHYKTREQANNVAQIVGRGGCRAHVLSIVDVYLPQDPLHVDVEVVRQTAEAFAPTEEKEDEIPF